VLMDLRTQPHAKEGRLLCVRVDVVRAVLRKVYEPLAILIHSAGLFLKVQELLLLVTPQKFKF
jgi:hypothetical protein